MNKHIALKNIVHRAHHKRAQKRTANANVHNCNLQIIIITQGTGVIDASDLCISNLEHTLRGFVKYCII